MCDCYKIGGPWIAEDPDCPVHGTEAQSRREQEETERQTLEDRITALEEITERQAQQIRMLQDMVSQKGNE
jgi:hypothetical protein